MYTKRYSLRPLSLLDVEIPYLIQAAGKSFLLSEEDSVSFSRTIVTHTTARIFEAEVCKLF